MSNHGVKRAPAPTPKKKPGKKHRMFFFFGALIVFLTFVLKDAFREYLKDVNDSLTAAEHLYIIQQDIATLSERMIALEERLADERLGKNADQHNWPQEIKTAVQIMQEQEIDVKATFDEISRLVDKLPHGKEQIQKPLGEMKATIDKFGDKVDEVQKKSSTATAGPAELALVKLTFAYIAAVDIDVAITGSRVLEGVRSIEEQYERAYRSATRLSYFLYTFGWGLALFGRLRGFESAETAE